MKAEIKPSVPIVEENGILHLLRMMRKSCFCISTLANIRVSVDISSMSFLLDLQCVTFHMLAIYEERLSFVL